MSVKIDFKHRIAIKRARICQRLADGADLRRTQQSVNW